MVETGGYRRLNKHSIIPVLPRNIQSFAILVALVVFVALFYLYISAAGDVQSLREELKIMSSYNSKVKNELFDANVKMEKYSNSERKCKSEKNSMEMKFQECVSNADKDNNKRAQEIENLKAQLEEASKALAMEQESKKALEEKQNQNKDSSKIQQLNETINDLQKELSTKDVLIAQLKLSSLPSPGLLPIHSNDSLILQNATIISTSPYLQSNNSNIEQPGQEAPPSVNDKKEEEKPELGPVEGDSPIAFDRKEAKENPVAFEQKKEENAAVVPPPLVNGNGEGKASDAADSTAKKSGLDAAEQEENEDGGQSNAIRGGQGEFLAAREPGARVKLAEANAREEKLEAGRGEAPLLKAAQQEEAKGENEDDDYKRF